MTYSTYNERRFPINIYRRTVAPPWKSKAQGALVRNRLGSLNIIYAFSWVEMLTRDMCEAQSERVTVQPLALAHPWGTYLLFDHVARWAVQS